MSNGFKYSLLSFLFVSLTLLTGCMSGPPGIMRRSFEDRGNNSLVTTELESLWKERTIRLSPVIEGSSGFPLFGDMGQGTGRMETTFPLSASATLVDSVLIDTGIKDFSELAKMNGSEKALYKANYDDIHKPDEYLFIWLELRTSYSKDLLNLDNWSIFLEDDKGNQFDPASLVEYKEKDSQNPDNLRPGSGSNNYWQVTSKVLQLYFPRKKFDGSLLLNKDIKSVKLVMFNWNNNARFEGKWYTNPKDNYSLISMKPESN